MRWIENSFGYFHRKKKKKKKATIACGRYSGLRPITFISVQCIQIQCIANQATEVLITVARSDSASKRSNLMAGHKWKKMFLAVLVIWCNEKCRKMLRLPAILRNEKWEQLSLKQNFITVLVTCPKCFPLPINIAFIVPKFSSAICSWS